MQRRRGGKFRKDIRVESKKPRLPSLRDHWYQLSHDVDNLAKSKPPKDAYHEAAELLETRMDEWHKLVRQIKAQDPTAQHIHPQLAAAAWNQVIFLAARAGMPSAAWRTFCEMKREHVRPTARTYSGYFSSLVSAIRTRKIDLKSSSAWTEHVPKLFEGLESIHTQAARTQPADEVSWHARAIEDATGAKLRPAVSASKQRVVHDTLKDVHAVAVAYSSYISLLFALQQHAEALKVWDQICPDMYPGRSAQNTQPRLPRHLFATAKTYTAIMRDLASCRMPIRSKQDAIRNIWNRWQFDLLAASRTQSDASPLLDVTAIKTLVWALSILPPADAVKNVNALLGTYCGVEFHHTPKVIRYSVPSTWQPIHFGSSAMFMDVLAFYDHHQLYTQVMDCYEHAEQTKNQVDAVDPGRIPEAKQLYQKAFKASNVAKQ
ncbi:hypothetical protein MPSI1_001519 [Malassezia psittaci]|uniref:Uncharacterized protein n=1 Tax=Malassezia psittaci TaxID=1821823 RepID=A0AAF0JDY8_9BASI|nr:hypothetical protein MPSI1_001519 [Malassezia psittaci]